MEEKEVMDLSMLSDEEAALLEALLGKIDPPKKKKDSSRCIVTKGLKPYKLKIVYNCRTCGQSTDSYFLMEPATDGTGLVSRTTQKFEDPDSINDRFCNCCAHCRSYLGRLEKEELISVALRALAMI